MERLNYHHLLYFYTVAREGSVARASLRLGLKQPTVSAQIHALENKLGRKLFERSGRGLKLTPAGETVLRHAERIFTMGGELLSALDGQADVVPSLAVGLSSSIPQPLAANLLNSLFALNPRPVLTITEGSPQDLAAALSSRALLFALTDLHPRQSHPDRGASAILHSRALLESPVELFAPPALARRLRVDFPLRLAAAPVLMHPSGALRCEVESWLAARKITACTLAEMPHPEFHAASVGAAIFAPGILRQSLKKLHGLLPVGELEGLRWRLFLATADKGVKHRGLDAVLRAARGMR
jgi:LysR family transcriptional activator of nhaA